MGSLVVASRTNRPAADKIRLFVYFTISKTAVGGRKLSHRKPRKLPHIIPMKGQDNIRFRNASIHQFISHHRFRIIHLNPNFIIFNVELERAEIDMFLIRPTQSY